MPILNAANGGHKPAQMQSEYVNRRTKEGIMAKNYSEAHHKAINKYRNKTYKAYNVVLRNEEDSDLIEAIETAKANKVTIRQWLRSVYESGYTEEQLIEAFGNFKGVMTPETVKRILASIKR